MTTLARLALLLGTLAMAARASAQAPEGDPAETARVRFEEANAAADREDFVEARRLFEESLSLLPRPATAVNLAQVLRSMGALLESERVLVAIESGTYGEMSERLAPIVSTALGDVRAELAVVTIEIRGAPTASVRIDAMEPVAVLEGTPLAVRVDPGAHLVLARGEDGRSTERSIRVEAREQLTLALELPAATAIATTESGPVEGGQGEDLGWLGWTLGAVGVAAVVGVVVGVVVATSPSTDAVSDPVWGTAAALRF